VPGIRGGATATRYRAPVRTGRRLAPLIGAAALALSAAPAAPAAGPGFALREVAAGLDGALLVTAPAGDPRLFVVQQNGLVRVVRGGRVKARPFLDLRRAVSKGYEQGLLGLAFHPDYARTGRLFVDYTNRAGDTRVVEYHVSSDPDRADAASARTVLGIDQPFENHNGGHLAFGPDGMLYMGTGDGGKYYDPFDNGQRLNSMLGKILRIDVDTGGGRPYAVPPDNPFARRTGTRGEIWHYGLRNPWRFSFDPARGDMWIGDVGQDHWEEIDVAPRGLSGLNFGWVAYEGRERLRGQAAPRGRVTAPVAVYSHAKGLSVTGGEVYRGGAVPALRGRYIFADYASGRVWTMRAGPRPGGLREVTGGIGRRLTAVTSFGRDGAGEIYVVAAGAVYKIVRAG
jgi:glucose/arabinose dehydrogenase